MSNKFLINGIDIVAIKILTPINTATLSFLFENGLQENIDLYKLLKEKAMTKIYMETHTNKIERTIFASISKLNKK